MKVDKLIRGNLVLTDKIVLGEIGVKDGKIVAISNHHYSFEAEEKFDFGDHYIFPGFIDVHVHCFSNPDEGFTKVSSGAAIGGITSILDMPYDLPRPINNAEEFELKKQKLEEETVVDCGLIATIKKSGGLEEILPLAEAGAAAFKMSLFETDEYRFPRIPDYEIYQSFQLIRQTGLRVGFHAENDDLIYPLIDSYKNEGRIDYLAHSETRPPVTETSAVLKLLEFAYWTDVKLHIFHVTLPRCIDFIQQYKKEGVDVTGETCYHYLLMDSEDIEEKGPLAKINPPLRSKKDVEGLWRQLQQKEIDFITSDHAPWGYDKKMKGVENIFQSPSGLPGIEVIVPLMFDAAVSNEKVSPIEFAKLMATNPAEEFRIQHKGSIEVGNDADITVVDPNKVWQLDASEFQSTAKWSPFNERKLKGSIEHTFVRGNVVYDGTNVTAGPGDGKFIPGIAYQSQKDEVL